MTTPPTTHAQPGGAHAHAAAHDAHGHHGHAAVDLGHHHISSSALFVRVLLVLLFLTFVTVAASRLDFGAANLLIAMLIASIKASFVIAFFMHVKWDTAINKIVFLGSFLFLAIMLAFTLGDLATRGRDELLNTVKAPVTEQWVHPALR